MIQDSDATDEELFAQAVAAGVWPAKHTRYWFEGYTGQKIEPHRFRRWLATRLAEAGA